MSSTLESFQYLKRLFPPDFIASLSEESFLHRLQVEQRLEADIWRQHIDNCLELAYRYDLVDADLEARLKKGDWESWQASMNELRVAKLLEGLFGTDCLRWRPQGRERREGEFELVLNKTDKPIFIEVKTVFPRELERLEHRIIEKLRHYTEQVPFPFALDVHIKEVGTSENFSGRKFKHFLTEELGKINAENMKAELIKLPDYRDDNTGLYLEITTIPVPPKPRQRTSYVGVIGGEARFLDNKEYLKHSLRKAYDQLPKEKQPCLAILCSSTAFPIDEDDMLNALLGTLALRVYYSIDRTAKVPEPKWFRKLDGFYHPRRNRHLSATGLFKEKPLGRGIEEKLEIYHNPFTANLLDDFIFKGKGVRQLVRKSETEMGWID